MPKARKSYEAPEIGSAAQRMARALVRRAADGDTEALEQLVALEALVTRTAIPDAIKGLHDKGLSWSQIAYVTGTTRQGAAKRAALA